MFSYRAYGLGVQSDFPLPELVEHSGPTQVAVRLGRLDPRLFGLDLTRRNYAVGKEEACFFWKELGGFHISCRGEIRVDPREGGEDRLLRLLIMNQAMGILLYQRGYFLLHASCVAVEGQALVFAGQSHWGKSTLAAALYLRGHPFVADDMTAILVQPGGAMVLPGFPEAKLWPDSLRMFGWEPDDFPRLDRHEEKRACRLPRRFSTEALPLKRIYILSDGDESDIKPLSPSETFVQLVTHSYAAESLREVRPASHFEQCRMLASTVPVFRLVHGRDWSKLSDLIGVVEKGLVESI